MNNSQITTSVSHVASVVRSGGVVAYATESVYGLGCDPFCDQAVRRLLTLKKRPESAGLIVCADDWSSCHNHVAELPDDVLARMQNSWPGAVTWLVPNRTFPSVVVGAHDTIALRVPGHAQARELCCQAGGLLVSTSANERGDLPCVTAEQVLALWPQGVDAILQGHVGDRERPSQLIDALSGKVFRE
jgi:L-threonylcarbamoyladenylate synthase